MLCLALCLLLATTLSATDPHVPYAGEPRCTGDCQKADPQSSMTRVMAMKKADWEACHNAGECPDTSLKSMGPAPCVDGVADIYDCCNTDLLSFVSLSDLGASGDGNDIWGWTDAAGKEYAIFGAYDGTSFIDISEPTNPKVLGFLPTHTVGSSWRDIKVYKDHAFIISEATNHGMQVFDLKQLSSLTGLSVLSEDYSPSAVPEFEESAHYAEFGSCHNIAINEDTGYAYAVGSRTCSSGLHIVDIRVPLEPEFSGCFGADGYVHDTQCINYEGPDTRYQGNEICFCYDEDALTIVDVSNKNNLVMLATQSYTGYQYTHQGWLLPGDRYLLLDDELDEVYNSNHHTRTLLWDVSDLRRPAYVNSFYSSKEVIDHNQYTLGARSFQSNYCGGLRILDTSAAISGGVLREAGYFDCSPNCDDTRFLGTWSNYPYFPSGNIVVSSIDRGLYVLKYNGNSGQCALNM